jgi:phosphoglycolate phosphatase
MARGAGARAVGVSWGYHPVAALTAAGAETVLARFEDFDAALDADLAEVSR